MRPDLRLLDVGCGAGFPALELAGRLGPKSHVVGLDPSRGAMARARAKATAYRLPNVELVEGVAEAMPFSKGTFDAVVSNNGLNNVADLEGALAECHRVLRDGGQLVATMNLPDSMMTLYRLLATSFRAGKEHQHSTDWAPTSPRVEALSQQLARRLRRPASSSTAS